MALVVKDVIIPSALAGQRNGRLDADLLVTVPGLYGLSSTHRLLAVAARSGAALIGTAFSEAGLRLGAAGPADGYRDYDQQVSTFTSHYSRTLLPGAPGDWKTWNGERWYRRPNKSIAAVPGQSNHGLGIARDYAQQLDADSAPESLTQEAVDWLNANCVRFGWSFELQPEPWHLRHFTGDILTPAVLQWEASNDVTPEEIRAAVKQAAYELANSVTNPVTPTDRNYRNDLWAAQQSGDGFPTDAGATPGGSSGALKVHLDAIVADLAQIKAALAAGGGGSGGVSAAEVEAIITERLNATKLQVD